MIWCCCWNLHHHNKIDDREMIVNSTFWYWLQKNTRISIPLLYYSFILLSKWTLVATVHFQIDFSSVHTVKVTSHYIKSANEEFCRLNIKSLNEREHIELINNYYWTIYLTFIMWTPFIQFLIPESFQISFCHFSLESLLMFSTCWCCYFLLLGIQFLLIVCEL